MNNFLVNKPIIKKICCSNYFPETKKELKEIIKDKIDKNGYYCDLNDIDVSNITDMSNLFICSRFNGDISLWDVSNVNNMESMFRFSSFDQDISSWNVFKVKCMKHMFEDSCFNHDISAWNVSNVENHEYFAKSSFIENNIDYLPKFK